MRKVSATTRFFGAIALWSLSFAAHAARVETTWEGAVIVSSVDSNDVALAGSAPAVGSRVTFTFTWDVAAAPGDFYGGARFPVEADYTSFGLPVWIRADVRFEDGWGLASTAFTGSGGVQQQVKIQDNCARCSFDAIGGAAWDYYGNFIQIATEGVEGTLHDTFIAGARVFDYTQSLINTLDIGQLLTWSPSAPGTFYADGGFSFRHVDRQNSEHSFSLEVVTRMDSLTSRLVPEPTTPALFGIGLTFLLTVRRARRAGSTATGCVARTGQPAARRQAGRSRQPCGQAIGSIERAD